MAGGASVFAFCATFFDAGCSFGADAWVGAVDAETFEEDREYQEGGEEAYCCEDELEVTRSGSWVGHVEGRPFMVGFVAMVGRFYIVWSVRVVRIMGWRGSMVAWAMVARLVFEGIEGSRMWWRRRWWWMVRLFRIEVIMKVDRNRWVRTMSRWRRRPTKLERTMWWWRAMVGVEWPFWWYN